MNYKFKFSIIIAIYNVEKYLTESIESIINQTLDFNKNVQLILVDDGSTDKSKEIALTYQDKFPNNILVLSKENGGQASARNLGLKYAKGKYVNFLDSDDYISENTLEEVYNFFEENESEVDIVAIPMILFERVSGPHRLNYKFEETKIIDLMKKPNMPQLSGSSAFIKYDAIKNFYFDEELVNLEDALIINKILLEKKKYGVLNNVSYYYRQRLDSNSIVDGMTSKKEFFTHRLKHFYKEIIDYSIEKDNKVPKFIQFLMIYDLQWLLKSPNLDLLTDEEVDEFWFYLNDVLSYIESSTIPHNHIILDQIKPFFMYLLNDKEYNINIEENGTVLFNTCTYNIDKLNRHRIWLDFIEIKNGFLNISGIFVSNFSNDSINITMTKSNEKGEATTILGDFVIYSHPDHNTLQYLGIDWRFSYNFDFKIPLVENELSKLSFNVHFQENDKKVLFKPYVSFNTFSGMSNYASYIVKDSFIVNCDGKSFFIMPYKYSKLIRYELATIKRILFNHEKYFLYACIFRFIYLLSFPFMKNKKIWLLEDRIDFADDNARCLFEYSNNLNDGIDKYFVVGRSSPDFDKLSENFNNILAFSSLKHKFLYIFAEKNISSYVNEDFINPFFDKNPRFWANFENSQRYFLQHGVTKDDISFFIKKYDKNLSLIATVSDLERESFLKEDYNYDDKTIQVLGFPRYDKLSTNKSKKQILFLPTWRITLTNEDVFINSNYFLRLNSLLNNEKLMNILNNEGYEFIFKPHPETVKYLDLIKTHDYVKISLNDSFSDLFKDSSLLITDYSSVFFDVAYLEKPVIYYQFDDYHYDEGYFKYRTMGFGEVIKEEFDLIKKLQYYINNDCIMEDKFRQRVNNFFKFRDTNNSKRVYEWIYNH